MTSVAPSQTPSTRPAELPAVPTSEGARWRIHVFAHTHWDREWYRTHERFRMQLVGMVDRVLHALDADPRFATFVLDGQTILIEDYLEVRPEEEPRVRRLVRAGRLEIGPWYVLPDEFLVSGESLVRNLLEGRRVAARFGDPLGVGYLPDPFGHVAQLPAILRGFGIDNIIFSRGMHDEFARTGSEFRWRALDRATDVLAIVQTSPYTNGYCNAELFGRGNGADDPEPYEAARELGEHLARSARTDVLVFAAGCDHETLQPELPEIVDRLGAVLPGADVQISGLDAVVGAVRDAEARLEAAGRPLEVLDGELRGSLHAPILASIFSARVPLKQDNDHIQVLLERHVEPLLALAVAAGVRPARDVEPFLRRAWRVLLKNHPHDSIGGCSIDRVHNEMPARTSRVEAICHGLIEDLRIALGLGAMAVVHDAEGRGGIAVRGDDSPVAILPGRPGHLARLDANTLGAGAEVVDARTVRAGALEVTVEDRSDPDGGPDRPMLVVRSGDSSTCLDWIDEADAGDEYDFGSIPGDEPVRARIVRSTARMLGGAVAELEVTHVFDLPRGLEEDRASRSPDVRHLEITSRVWVSGASPLAHLVAQFDNRADDHRLRLRAVLAESADSVTALGHFGEVRRPVRPVAPKVPWKQDPPGLDHCAGAVRLNAAAPVLLAGRGIHEYEARPLAEGATALELTVLRAVGWLSRDDISGRPGHAGPGLETPGAQCHGPHRVELAIGVGAEATSFDAARAFLTPPMVFEQFGVEAVQESGSRARVRDVLAVTPEDPSARIEELGWSIGGTGVVPSACKLAEDGSGDLIVRWWAPDAATNKPARARLAIAAPVDAVLRARLDERPLGPAPFVDGVVDLPVRPGAVVTIRVVLKRANS